METTARDRPAKQPILVVDDEPDVLAGLRSLLRRGYRVLTAADAAAAKGILAVEPVDVLVTDQRMPEVNGSQLLADVRRTHPHVVGILMTGYADLAHVIDAINEGDVYRYVSKPWEPADIQAAVAQAAEKHRLEADNRRLLERLAEQNRLKDAFLQVTSHELNTPLTIAGGMLQLGLMKADDAGQRDLLARAAQAVQRLQTVVADMFKSLRRPEGPSLELERRPLAVAELLADARDQMKPFLEARGQVIVIDAAAGLHVAGSRQHLLEVFENLFSNAIKFAADGARTTVAAAAENGTVRIDVSDRGTGIDPADRPHVFEPFFCSLDTLSHSSGEFQFGKRGIGLGLTIVRHFVELHGGTVDLSELPEGTRATVRLPAAEAAPAG